MKIIGLFLIIIILLNEGFSQNNLVPNSDLELHTGAGLSLIDFSVTVLNSWYKPTDGTPDYFNEDAPTNSGTIIPYTCFGYQYAHSGKGMAGGFLYVGSPTQTGKNYREYIQSRLIQKMEAGKVYYVSFWVSPTYNTENTNQSAKHTYNFTTDDIGLHLSAQKIENYNGNIGDDELLNVIPQIRNPIGNYLTDTSKWYKIEGCYTAIGGEEWITIGNFKDDEHTNLLLLCNYTDVTSEDSIVYMYIDDVSVIGMGDIHSVNNDTSVCENQAFSKELIAPSTGNSYSWSTGDTTQSILVNHTGIYWYEMELECGKLRDTIYITAISIPEMNLGNDISQCENLPEITLQGSQGFIHYLWNNGDTTQITTISQSGIYYVIGTHICGTKTDTIQVSYFPIPNLPQVQDTSYCENENAIPLQATGTNLLWYNSLSDNIGDTLSPIPATNHRGIYDYYVTQTEHNCESEKAKIKVKINALPSFILPTTYNMCENERIEIGVNISENYSYSWNTNEATPIIEVDETGIYELFASNNCGTISQKTEVKSYNCRLCLIIPNAFSPNFDGNNDTFFPVIRCPMIDYTFIIFDRWGRKIVETNDPNYEWNGTNKGQNAPEGVYAYRIFYTNSLNNISQNIGGTITLIR